MHGPLWGLSPLGPGGRDRIIKEPLCSRQDLAIPDCSCVGAITAQGAEALEAQIVRLGVYRQCSRAATLRTTYPASTSRKATS